MKKAVVIGAGMMGHGIAEVLAMAGLEVAMVDVSDEVLKKGMDLIRWSLGKFVEKRRIREEDAKTTISRIKPIIDLEDAVKDADLVVEAITEDLEVKKQMFAKVDKAAPKHAIFASNTSALSITEMSKATDRPDKVVGMHFFNPPALMELVEVIKGDHTSDETVNLIVDLAKKIGKTPVVVKKDVRGFIVNRVLALVFNEAFWSVHRGEATTEEVDSAVKYKAGFPMGAFELADWIGLDVLYDVSKVMMDAYGEKAKLCPTIEQLVKEGKLGKKSGKGFYDWTVGRPRIPFRLADKFDIQRVYAMAINEAASLVYEEVADPRDIDTAMKLGLGWPSGPCELADRLGIDVALNKLKELYAKYGEEMYKSCPLLEEYVNKGWLGRKAKRGFYEYE